MTERQLPRAGRDDSRPGKPDGLRHVLVLFVLAVPAFAHDVISTKLTWTEHVSRIFYKRCVSCHREGGAAPMPLVTYDQVRPWAKAIKLQILSRQMPPWGPRKGYGDFRDDLSLSQEEIAVISSWVEGGAPRGELLYLDVGKLPTEFPENEPPPAEKRAVANGLKIEAPVRVLGLEAAGAIEMRALLPGGQVTPLVWIPSADARAERTYWYREAVALPAGTEIQLFAGDGAKASLLLEPR